MNVSTSWIELLTNPDGMRMVRRCSPVRSLVAAGSCSKGAAVLSSSRIRAWFPFSFTRPMDGVDDLIALSLEGSRVRIRCT